MIESEEDLKKNAEYVQHEWSGIIVKVDGNQEPTNQTTILAYQDEKERKVSSKVLMVLVAALILIPIASTLTFASSLWFMTALAGMILGVILVRKELGLTGEKVEEFCRSGKNTDCGKVLESDAATIWKGVKLTDMVNGYFAAQLLMILVATQGGIATDLLASLGLISWLALPMIIYSYYYQGVVTKKWCKLCILVTAVLLGQGILSLFLLSPFENNFSLNPLVLSYSGILILSFIGLAAYLKQNFKKAKDLESENLLAMRVVKSPAVFHSLLSKERMASLQEFTHQMVMGDVNAQHTLYLTLNLSCEPCRKTFNKLTEVLKRQNLRVNLTLAPNGQVLNGLTDNEYFTQYWVDNVSRSDDAPSKTLEMMKDWYDNIESKEIFRKAYPLQSDELSKEAAKLIDEQGTWMMLNGVQRSPTMFFNLRNMPPHYRMDMLAPALQYILAELPVPVQQQLV